MTEQSGLEPDVQLEEAEQRMDCELTQAVETEETSSVIEQLILDQTETAKVTEADKSSADENEAISELIEHSLETEEEETTEEPPVENEAVFELIEHSLETEAEKTTG